ncbi:UNKNOWN [Stylonychia lemnae]|uniref:Uncharacterized protein n=1 Tax=Stylonychia lemnae TaxID=5949 RepID=A0A077ZYH7_STYLE|nr:UNKNOWN [Stylonychia lemnae]|eukprot:CDW74667.1 UNKNOWN [Stylonychia lemnae]
MNNKLSLIQRQPLNPVGVSILLINDQIIQNSEGNNSQKLSSIRAESISQETLLDYQNKQKLIQGNPSEIIFNQKFKEINLSYHQNLENLQTIANDADKYNKLLNEVTNMLEEEVKSSHDNAILTLQTDWMDTMDSIIENAVHISGIIKDDLNQYSIYKLLSVVGDVHKYWYGFRDTQRYLTSDTDESQNLKFDHRFFKDELNARDRLECVIEFLDPDSAQKAIDSLNNFTTNKGSTLAIAPLSTVQFEDEQQQQQDQDYQELDLNGDQNQDYERQQQDGEEEDNMIIDQDNGNVEMMIEDQDQNNQIMIDEESPNQQAYDFIQNQDSNTNGNNSMAIADPTSQPIDNECIVQIERNEENLQYLEEAYIEKAELLNEPICDSSQSTPAITIENSIILDNPIHTEDHQKLSQEDLKLFYEEPAGVQSTLMATQFLKNASQINKSELQKSLSLRYIKGIKLNLQNQPEEQLLQHKRTRNTITGNQLISSVIDLNMMTTANSLQNDRQLLASFDKQRKVQFSNTLISINNDKSVNLIQEKESRKPSFLLEKCRIQQILLQNVKKQQKNSRNGMITEKSELNKSKKKIILRKEGIVQNQQNQNKLIQNKMQSSMTSLVENENKPTYRMGPKVDYGQNQSPQKIGKKISVFDRLHSGLKRQVLEYSDITLKLGNQNIETNQSLKQLSTRKSPDQAMISPKANKQSNINSQRMQMFQTSLKKKPQGTPAGKLSIIQQKQQHRTMQSNPITRNVSPQRVSKNEMERLVTNYRSTDKDSIKYTQSVQSIERMKKEIQSVFQSPSKCQSPKSRQSSSHRGDKNVVIRLSQDSLARMQKKQYLQQFSGLTNEEIQEINQKRMQQGFRNLKQRYFTSQSSKSLKNNIYTDSNSTSKLDVNTDCQTRTRGDSGNYFISQNQIHQQFDNDILIPTEKIQDFFFMDDEEEQEQYGFSSKKASIAISGNILKEKAKDEEMIKSKEQTQDSKFDSIDLIKGLLKAMQVAHADKNVILFERIKSVISIMAKGSQQKGDENGKDKDENEGDENIKSNKIIMTEIMSLLLKQNKDQQMQKAYTDTFMFLTKYFYQSNSQKLQKFLIFTYKELLKTFLSGRTQSNTINVKFFQTAFEQNPTLGWNFVKMLLKCIVSLKQGKDKTEGQAESRKESVSGDALMESDEKKNKKKDKKKNKKGDDDDEAEGDGSRSNHQRLQAVELFGLLIKESLNHELAREALQKNLQLISTVIIKVIETCDSWKNKKVKKTQQVVILFVKAARTLLNPKNQEPVDKELIRKEGLLIIKAIEKECEKDKQMSNLKGKIKEIKNIIDHL